MAKHKLSPGAYLYIADAAMVTKDNLRAIDENLFVTRLPFTSDEASRVVAESTHSLALSAFKRRLNKSTLHSENGWGKRVLNT